MPCWRHCKLSIQVLLSEVLLSVIPWSSATLQHTSISILLSNFCVQIKLLCHDCQEATSITPLSKLHVTRCSTAMQLECLVFCPCSLGRASLPRPHCLMLTKQQPLSKAASMSWVKLTCDQEQFGHLSEVYAMMWRVHKSQKIDDTRCCVQMLNDPDHLLMVAIIILHYGEACQKAGVTSIPDEVILEHALAPYLGARALPMAWEVAELMFWAALSARQLPCRYVLFTCTGCQASVTKYMTPLDHTTNKQLETDCETIKSPTPCTKGECVLAVTLLNAYCTLLKRAQGFWCDELKCAWMLLLKCWLCTLQQQQQQASGLRHQKAFLMNVIC